MPLYGADGSTFIGGEQGPIGPEGPQGPAGTDGITITDVSLNVSDELIVTYSDATTANFGVVRGPQGPAGADGLPGADGADGAIGPAGPQGEDGPQGPQGAQGPAGSAGPTGPTGPTGPRGLRGADGATGPAGPEGPQGPQGPKGDKGAIGPVGPQGATGAAGSDGDEIVSASFDANNNLILVMSDGGQVNAGSLGVATDRVGEIVFFAGDPGAMYLLCDGSQYSETTYPDLAASGLTPITSVPGGISSMAFVSYDNNNVGTNQGDSSVRKTKISNDVLLVSGDDYYPVIFNTTNTDFKSEVIFRDGGSFIQIIEFIVPMPEQAAGGYIPVLCKRGNSMAYFRMPDSTTPSDTSDTVFSDVLDYGPVGLADIVDSGLSTMDSSYSSATGTPFYVSGEMCYIACDGSTKVHLITSDDGGTTFTWRADLSTIGGLVRNVAIGSDGSIMLQRATNFTLYASLADLKVDNGTVINVTAPYSNSSVSAAYNGATNMWILAESDSGSSNYHNGTIFFYDPVADTTTSYVHRNIAGGTDCVEVAAAGTGFIVTDSASGEIIYYESANPGTVLADTQVDSAFPLIRIGYTFFDDFNDTFTLAAQGSSWYLVTYTTVIGSTDTYFLPDVPSTGDASAYVRATNE